MYNRHTFIKEKVSNNAFDYEIRQKFHDSPFLIVPSLLDLTNEPSLKQSDVLSKTDIPPTESNKLEAASTAYLKSSLQKLKVGQEIVFEALDDDGHLKSCQGLEYFLKIQVYPHQNIYIFDNHNHAFYFWHLERYEGRVKDSSTLIHVDQHKDTRIPINFLPLEDSHDLTKVYNYTNSILNVGNFIPPAVKTGLLKEIIFLDSESTLQNFSSEKIEKFQPQFNGEIQPFILDIDIDFFAPELDYIDNNLKLTIIKKLLPHASTVTIATSPFFIDQELAIDWIRKIFE